MATGNQQLGFAIRAVNEASRALKDVQMDLKGVGESAEDAQESLADAQRSWEGFGGVVEGLADAGGNAERALQGVGDITGFLNEQFGISLGPMEKYAKSFADLGGGIEGVLQGGPALVGQIKGIVTSLPPAIASTWAYVSALLAQAVAFIAANAPILLIIGSIALLAAGVFLLIRHWDEIVAKFPIIGQVAEKAKEGFDKVTGAAKAVLDFMKGNWPEIAVLISGPFAPIVLLATDAFGVRSAIQDAFEFAKRFVKEHWPEIATIISGPFFPIVALATDAFGVRTALQNGMTAAKDFVSDRVDDIVGFFTGLPGRLGETLDSALGAGTKLGEAIRDGLVTGLSKIVDKVGDITGALISALKAAWNSAIDWADRSFKLKVDLGPLGSLEVDPDLSIFKLAKGVRNFAGGLAVVGEEGPELVRLPRGADVYTARETRGMLSGDGGGGGLTVVIQGNVYGVDHLMYEIDRAAKRAGLAGLT